MVGILSVAGGGSELLPGGAKAQGEGRVRRAPTSKAFTRGFHERTQGCLPLAPGVRGMREKRWGKN